MIPRRAQIFNARPAARHVAWNMVFEKCIIKSKQNSVARVSGYQYEIQQNEIGSSSQFNCELNSVNIKINTF